MKTTELTGAALDWAVAKCAGVEVFSEAGGFYVYTHDDPDGYHRCAYTPSRDWAQGGPIIERGGIAISPHDTLGWAAFQSHTAIDGVIYKDYFGPTPLIAAMRCYVAAKLGDTVDVPEELG